MFKTQEKWGSSKRITLLWLAAMLLWAGCVCVGIVSSMLGGPMFILGQISGVTLNLLSLSILLSGRFANWYWHVRPLARKVRSADWRLCPGCTYPYEGDGAVICSECGERFLGWQARADWRGWIKPPRARGLK